MGRFGHWVCRESWAHKRLFNLPPQFSRLGTQGPASPFLFIICYSLSVNVVYVWVGLGFFLSLLTSSYDAIKMFFHVQAFQMGEKILLGYVASPARRSILTPLRETYAPAGDKEERRKKRKEKDIDANID